MSDDITMTSDITVTEIERWGGDWKIAAAAKVSTDPEESRRIAEAEDAEGTYGLIKYLMKHHHGSPLEHSGCTIFVHAPIFVFREFHRHRIFSYSEMSARYTKLEPIFWMPPPMREMVPIEGFKSARPEFGPPSKAQYDQTAAWLTTQARSAWAAYEGLLATGIAKEVARSVLPVGIYSKCWATTNLRSWLNFLSLRTSNPEAMFVSYPQKEIEEVARQVEAKWESICPLAMKAWNVVGRISI